MRSKLPSEEQHVALVTLVQRALSLVRGPFLDGFWLGEDTPFDEWREQQQRQWQVRLLLLLDRLSSWQEAAGEFEPARATLTRWVALDPLAEEASRRGWPRRCRSSPRQTLSPWLNTFARWRRAAGTPPSPRPQ